MYIFIILYIVFIWYLIYRVHQKMREEKIDQVWTALTKSQKKCPPHFWNYEYDSIGNYFMICKFCRRRPGDPSIYGEG